MDNLFANPEFDIFYLISQGFALAALILNLYAFQKRRKIQILNYNVVGTLCSVFHYLFLGAWAGVATKAVGTARNVFGAYEIHKHKTSKIAPLVFVAFYVISGFITYNSPASLLPIVASCIHTIAVFIGNAQRLRYVATLASMLWLIYDVIVISIVGVVAEVIFIVNTMLAIYRYRDRKKHEKRKKRQQI
ncbi:YgjV family protein [Candidatus Saccharibacteria bacterium]|nr:YgjV family protein [Candidatus Saccharibacteria bacterium]